ncbi:ribosomal RNA adenine methyltransferase KsgA/Erm [Thamnidium elegans]|nr:ribosomal RNA adenine methyltransferase KsgA/Erm [Thamnidium elegans]
MSRAKVIEFSEKVPKLAEWSKQFRYRSAIPRITLASPSIAAKGIKKMDLPNVENMTAVEIYPGLGVWTRAMKDIGFKRIITLEPQNLYFNWVEGMSKVSSGLEVLKKDGYDWEAYNDLKDPKYIGTMENKDWSKVHPDLFFTGTLPKGSRGEQLLAQFTTCIVNKMAMHSLGRIRMAFWVPDTLYQKYVAPPKNHIRCKMSVIAEACAKVDLICTTAPDDMYPNSLYHLISIVPYEKTQWDVFEYVLKHLFVMQKRSLKHMVK